MDKNELLKRIKEENEASDSPYEASVARGFALHALLWSSLLGVVLYTLKAIFNKSCDLGLLVCPLFAFSFLSVASAIKTPTVLRVAVAVVLSLVFLVSLAILVLYGEVEL